MATRRCWSCPKHLWVICFPNNCLISQAPPLAFICLGTKQKKQQITQHKFLGLCKIYEKMATGDFAKLAKHILPKHILPNGGFSRWFTMVRIREKKTSKFKSLKNKEHPQISGLQITPVPHFFPKCLVKNHPRFNKFQEKRSVPSRSCSTRWPSGWGRNA